MMKLHDIFNSYLVNIFNSKLNFIRYYPEGNRIIDCLNFLTDSTNEIDSIDYSELEDIYQCNIFVFRNIKSQKKR